MESSVYSTTWIEEGFGRDAQITAPIHKNDRALKEKNKRGYKHVPHREKPAQVVAKRNARERRRVQAVNSAFARLRKAIPIENSRGKRISKVKTLHNAINYIRNLLQLLTEDQYFPLQTHFYSYKTNEDFFDNFSFEDEF